MRMYLAALILVLGGCLSPVRTQAKLGVLTRDPVTKTASDVRQTGGRDVVNVSPNLAVSGGGGILFLLALIALVNWARARRTLATVIGAIEQLNPVPAAKAKRRVLRAALAHGVADYLHAAVRRWEKRKNGSKMKTPNRR